MDYYRGFHFCAVLPAVLEHCVVYYRQRLHLPSQHYLLGLLPVYPDSSHSVLDMGMSAGVSVLAIGPQQSFRAKLWLLAKESNS